MRQRAYLGLSPEWIKANFDLEKLDLARLFVSGWSRGERAFVSVISHRLPTESPQLFRTNFIDTISATGLE
jgi:hypothetical protein